MTGWLLLLTSVFFLFGATMYVGTMWVLKLFLYPTWRSLTRDNVPVHFGVPTLLATRFFTGVVPVMFVAAVVLVVTEWGTAYLAWAAVCLLGIVFLTVIGQRLIIPINQRIRGGAYATQAELVSLLERWMRLNDLRFWGSSVTWLAIVGYVVSRGDLLAALR